MSADTVLPLGLRCRSWTQHVGAGLLLAITSATVTARAAGETSTAHPETSNPLFADGLRALDARQYPKAKQLFERLYRTSATPEVLYQLGRVAQGEGKHVLAADLFRRYRELVGGQEDAASKSVIDGHLAALKQPVTELRIVAPEGDFLSIDDQLIGRSPLIGTVLIAPGRHRFAFDSKGSRFESDDLEIPDDRPAQVNLSEGGNGGAVAILSLLPAAALVFDSNLDINTAFTAELRRSTAVNIAKEQTVLLAVDRTRPLFEREPAGCQDRPDCLARIAEASGARSILLVRQNRPSKRVDARYPLLGAKLSIYDAATKQTAAEATYICDNCNPSQVIDKFGQAMGELIISSNRRKRVMISIQTTPTEASVYIDNIHIGATPIEHMSFTGHRSVKILKYGFRPYAQKIGVMGDRENTVSVSLMPGSSALYRRTTGSIVLGSVWLGIGLITLGFGISGVAIDGSCDESVAPTAPTCPIIYKTALAGRSLLGVGAAVSAVGIVVSSVPWKKVTH